MSPGLVVTLVVALVVVAAVVVVARRRRANDGVDSFRRQIDALSPEARRPVVDQVHHAAGRPTDEGADATEDDDADEDGARGT